MDEMLIDIKTAMAQSRAGRRFIAQMTIYNSGNFERLREFIEQGYDAALLEKQSIDERLQSFVDTFETTGKLRVYDPISVDKYRIVLLMEGQDGKLYYNRMKVTKDYPHSITQYVHRLHGTDQ